MSALKKDRSKDGSRTVCSVCLENYVAGDKVRRPSPRMRLNVHCVWGLACALSKLCSRRQRHARAQGCAVVARALQVCSCPAKVPV